MSDQQKNKITNQTMKERIHGASEIEEAIMKVIEKEDTDKQKKSSKKDILSA